MVMKRKELFAATAIVLFAFSCTHPDQQESPRVNADSVAGTNTNDTRFGVERETYRTRLSERMDRLNGEIEEARRNRSSEKDKSKWRSYDTAIERRESTRARLKGWLDSLGNQTEESWNGFKSRVNDYVNDRKGDSI
jgi:hypothetical protein